MAANQLFDTSLYNDANLQAYYKLEDVSDSKGANTLTNNNTVAFNAGKFNNAADGGSSNSNKSLTSTNQFEIANTTACTLMGWINVTTAPGNNVTQSYISYIAGTTGDYQRGIQYWNNGGTLTLRGNSYGATNVFSDYETTLTIGTWYHVALVDTGTNIIVYLNGSAVAGPTTRAAVTESDNFGRTGLGLLQRDTDLYSSGLIDDVAVFDRALSATEIEDYYSGALNNVSGGMFFAML